MVKRRIMPEDVIINCSKVSLFFLKCEEAVLSLFNKTNFPDFACPHQKKSQTLYREFVSYLDSRTPFHKDFIQLHI
jgi:hypothetical protein